MKILAAPQPEYFPGLTFFLKMMLADKFVIADDLQYSRHSLVNRAKIKTSSGSQWLSVSVFTKGKGNQKIKEIQIVSEIHWQRKHWRSIKSNYKYAPYFEYYESFLEQVFHEDWESLLKLNIFIIEFLKRQLTIETVLSFSSSVNSIKKGTENIINIVKYYKCAHYLIFDYELQFIDQILMHEAEIKLIVKKFKYPHYRQQFEPFEKNLSTLDVLLNTGRDSRKIIESGLQE